VQTVHSHSLRLGTVWAARERQIDERARAKEQENSLQHTTTAMISSLTHSLSFSLCLLYVCVRVLYAMLSTGAGVLHAG